MFESKMDILADDSATYWIEFLPSELEHGVCTI